MIPRKLAGYAVDLFKKYPVITITGPRQSGKTTLAKHAFNDLPYYNLESIETRNFAIEDPVGFLNQCPDGAVIDEVQNAPDLTSYIQVRIDESGKDGMYVLTGSRQFEVIEAVNQSLAGRTAMLKLLPFSISEMGSKFGKLKIDEYILKGFYPRIHDKKLEPSRALSDYYSTYIERDVRKISSIHNLNQFQKFVHLCAGRVGQLLNYSSLANDVGISHSTVREWMSILEASYVVFLLKPYWANVNKRVIKSPKIYFYDVGLAAHLMGIDELSQVAYHPLRGNLFENLVVIEILKYRYNIGKNNNLFFFRDSKGNEIDVFYEVANKIIPIEIKAGETINDDYFKGFSYMDKNLLLETPQKILVYAGKRKEIRNGTIIRDVMNLNSVLEEI